MKNYKGIIVERGYDDPGSGSIDVNGAIFNGSVPVLQNHDITLPIGSAKLYVEDNVIKADIDLFNDFRGWPSVGFMVIERDGNIVKKCKIYNIGICSQPNADPLITII